MSDTAMKRLGLKVMPDVGLKVTMCKAALVHEAQSTDELMYYAPSYRLAENCTSLQEPPQISKRQIFHCDED